jgi:hypothetical protein
MEALDLEAVTCVFADLKHRCMDISDKLKDLTHDGDVL